MEKICSVCNNMFVTEYKHKKFCNYDCSCLYKKLTRDVKELFKLSEEQLKLREKLLKEKRVDDINTINKEKDDDKGVQP